MWIKIDKRLLNTDNINHIKSDDNYVSIYFSGRFDNSITLEDKDKKLFNFLVDKIAAHKVLNNA